MKKRRLLVPMVAVLLAAAPAMANPPACTPAQPTAKVEPAAQDVPEVTVNNGVRNPYVVKLNGNPSSPQNITYSWTQDSTDPYKVTLSNPTDVQPTFSAPDVGPSGTTLHFTLTVKDCSGFYSASTSVTVKVTNVDQNRAPVASAVVLPTETVNEGAVVTLDGSASSDPDGNSLTYQWTQLPGGTSVTINNSATATATFTAPNDAYPTGESLTFRLTVSDGYLSNYTEKVVTVVWVNDPPTASLSCPKSVNEGVPVTLDGSASSDPDNGIASYDWSQLSGGPSAGLSTYDPATASTISFTAPMLNSTFNTMKFGLKVTDKGTPGLFNTAECDVAVLDVTPPVISGADNITKEATSAAGAVALFTPTAHDAVDGDVDITCTPESGSIFALGTADVACSATDKSGNKTEAKFTVTVKDTTPPGIDAHADVTAEATGPSGAVVDYTSPVTSDIVDGAGTANCLPASGSTFALGTNTVTCNATDKAGNIAIPTTFSVIVKDTTPPTINGVPTVNPIEATGPAGAKVTFTTPTATDLVDGTVAVTCAPVSGSTFALGTNTVTCNATDKAGNLAKAEFNVTVQDTTPPVIAPHADVTAEATGPAGAIVSYTSPTTSDIVDGTGSANCLPAIGSTFALGTTTVTCNATDNAGNKTKTPTTFSVIVKDTTPPVIAAHADESAFATSVSGAIVNYAPPATSDIVDGAGTASCLPASGSTFALGTTTVTCNATDKAGNTTPPTTFKVAVTYKFNGLLSPYSPDKAYKIKSAIPIKWQYASATGAVLPSATANPSVVIYQVTSGVDATDAIILDDAGASGYQYDSTTNTWQYNWKTTGLSAGTYDIYVQSSLTGQKDGPFKIQLSK